MKNINSETLSINKICTIIFSFLFTLVIFLICILNIYKFYPLLENFDQKVEDESIKTYITTIEEEYTNNFINKDGWIDLYGGAQKLMFKNEVGNFDVIKDKQGWLHMPKGSPSEEQHIKYASNLKALYSHVNDKNIPFLFVEAPSDYIDGKTLLPEGMSDVDNRGIDQFLKHVENQGIPYLDTRTLFKDFALEDIFYKTDHHWNLPAAFESFNAIIQILNREYSLNIDPEGKYTNPSNYTTEEYQNSFLGSRGIRVGALYAGKDDFSIYLPQYDGQYTNTYYSNHKKKWEKEGNFRAAFIDDKVLHNPNYKNKYNVFMYGSKYESRIINHSTQSKQKCLFISDSFGRAIIPYLSQCFYETRWIDPQKGRYTDSYKDYIDEFNPDCVIVLFNGRWQYNEIPL